MNESLFVFIMIEYCYLLERKKKQKTDIDILLIKS